MNFNHYKTLLFDCDGVILNSNPVKTNAFYNVALPYGQEAANALVNYHLQHMGKSRYKKLDYFLCDIVGKEFEQKELDVLLSTFADEVKSGLIKCEMVKGLKELREATPQSNWLVVSGGDQAELRDLFALRKINHYFNGGIFGSPDTKETILTREKKKGNIQLPSVFLGDSKYDYEVAQGIGADFIFLYAWSEFNEWENYFKNKNIKVTADISQLMY